MVEKVIDVPLPDALTPYLTQPVCIQLPKASSAKVQLPTGGSLKGVVDITKGIPDDCSLSFSLVLQLAPFLGGIECLVKLLKLIKPLIDIIKGLTDVPPKPPAEAIKEFAQAAIELAPCLALPTPVVMIPFVRDILCLIIKLLSCIIGQLKTIMSLIGGLSLQIGSAQAAGNSELLATLQCAQENAMASAGHMFSAIDPILVLLSLAEPFLGIAGVKPIEIPALASPESLEAMDQVISTLSGLVDTLKFVADGLGGCS